MAAADQLSRTQMFPPPRKKSCMKPCTIYLSIYQFCEWNLCNSMWGTRPVGGVNSRASAGC